uniref:Uncharacterized protein n=1 Tax=viral metagenome TaxID=1070528 RepID=A0A6C0E2T8_9ZZZZ
MKPNLFFKFSKNIGTFPFSKTLPPTQCNNGIPLDKYAGYGVNAWEVLYSIWVANQKTVGAKFTANQYLSSAPTTMPTNGPANIFIIRHGEKSSPTLYCLDNNGIYRSCQLVEFVNKLANDGYPISYIVTCNSCPFSASDSSMRPVQTVSMVSFMLNIPICIYGGSQDYAEVVSALYSSQYSGLNVLICWEHQAIQQLCLNILDTGALQTPSRLPSGIISGDSFFKVKNSCTDGNYLCSSTSSPLNPLFIPPPVGTIPGVGSNTQFYPYWNNNNFNSVYWLKSSKETNYIFDYVLFYQPCLTCYTSCDLNIGLYQPLPPPCEYGNNEYYDYGKLEIETNCEVPSNWKL